MAVMKKKTRGRPKSDEPQLESVSVRMTGVFRAALREYRRRQPVMPTETHVIRETVGAMLRKEGLL